MSICGKTEDVCCLFNPIWTGLFANPKRLGGGEGKMAQPPNLAISSQMTMKLGKGILWIEIFSNSHKFLMLQLKK